MSEQSEGKMVMRSVYLTESLDERLRSASFKLRRSKGDLIREFVDQGLSRLQAEHADIVTTSKPVLSQALAHQMVQANIPQDDAEAMAEAAIEEVRLAEATAA